jgi:tyrosine-protein phosphatase
MDAESSGEDADEDMENSVIMQEARALDKAMEDRIVARKASTSSIGSTGSGIGMGPVWRNRYASRKRSGSIASYGTSNSVISEDLLEEDEEEHLLRVGGGFDSERPISGQTTESSASNSPDDENDDASDIPPFASPPTARLAPPPSAPAWRTSFTALPPPPATAVRSSFDLPPVPPVVKSKRRPLSMSISVLPAVPSSPIVIEQDSVPEATPPPKPLAMSLPPMRPLNIRKRVESSKPAPPPLHLRHSVLRRPSASSTVSSASNKSVEIAQTPSQTLFVFPPSPTLATKVQTPSTMTLTSESAVGSVPFPTISTPRISTFQKRGRTLSFIGVGSPPTPTVGFSKVDARGYVGFPS